MKLGSICNTVAPTFNIVLVIMHFIVVFPDAVRFPFELTNWLHESYNPVCSRLQIELKSSAVSLD